MNAQKHVLDKIEGGFERQSKKVKISKEETKTFSKQTEGDWKSAHPKRKLNTRNFYAFNVYCFLCNKFGHKALSCKNKVKNIPSFTRKNYNPFTPLMDFSSVCHNYNNFGHKEQVFRTIFYDPSKQNEKEDNSIKRKEMTSKVWKKKDKSMFVQIALHVENCLFIPCFMQKFSNSFDVNSPPWFDLRHFILVFASFSTNSLKALNLSKASDFSFKNVTQVILE